jgi:hypothetical protein
MASSIFGPKQGGNSILSMLSNPKAAADYLDSIGAKCTLPNGQQATIGQLADMVRGKTPQQAFRENGLDFDKARNHLR